MPAQAHHLGRPFHFQLDHPPDRRQLPAMGEAICKANASELGKLGAKIRWEKHRIAEAERARTAEIYDLSAALTAAELREVIKNRPNGQPPKPKPETFVEQSLRKVRERMAEILEAMAGAPLGVEKLAAGLAKLEEVERRFSGRSLPVTVKPTLPRKAAAGFITHGAPEPEPEPAEDLADAPDLAGEVATMAQDDQAADLHPAEPAAEPANSVQLVDK